MRRFVAVLAGSAIALALVETAARMHDGVEFLPGGRLYGTVPSTHGANASGFHERELPVEDPTVRRIAVLGDSMTWGTTTPEGAWTRHAEQVMGAPWQVMNFSTYGYDTAQQRATLDEVWRFDPELIVVAAYWNDLFPTRTIDLGGPIWLADRDPLWWASATWRRIHGAWMVRDYDPGPDLPAFAAALRSIADAASRCAAATVLVMLHPHRCPCPKEEAWADEMLAATSVPSIDTRGVLQPEPGNPDGEHPGAEGHRRLGEFVGRALLNRPAPAPARTPPAKKAPRKCVSDARASSP